MHAFRNWSLTRQVFVYLALVGVVPLLLVAVSTYFSLSDSFVRRALIDQRNLLEAERQHIILIQEQVESLIDNISGVELIRTELDQPFESVTAFRQLATEARVGSILNGYLNVRGIVSIHLFGRRGTHFRVGDTLDFDPGFAEHAAPLIQQARESGARIFWPGVEQNINHRSGTQRVLPAIKILYDVDRENLERIETGVIMVNYSLDHLAGQFAGAERSVASSRVLLDQHGRVIFHSAGTAEGTAAPDGSFSRVMERGASGHMVEVDDRIWYRVLVPLERAGWSLLSLTPRDAILSGFEQLRDRTIIAVTLAVLIVAVISMRFSRSVVTPADRIAQSFRRLNAGADDVQPLPGGGTGEIGELTNLFNRFLEGLAERERANQMARESAVVFSVSSEAILITDRRGVIKLVNPAFTRITGYDPEEAIGRKASLLKSERHDEDLYQQIWQQLLSTGHWEGELYNRRKNGQVYPTWQTISAVRDASGEPVEYVAMFADITTRKQAESERERLQREASQSHKMQALGQLTGGIAHDFNNILGIIMGYTALALKKSGNNADPGLTNYLDTVMSASERARNLVSQMLTYSRSEVVKAQNLQLAPLVAGYVDMLRPVIPSSIAMSFAHEENLPDVSVDSVGLQQIVMNLCLNARDAMRGVGSIRVNLKSSHIDDAECAACHRRLHGHWVELSVADTGSGMDSSVIDHIFEPFFTTKDVGEGVGMGLAVVQGIIQRHDAHVVLESAPGRGTVFRVLFPPATVAESALQNGNSPGADAPGAGEGRRVLVVDDEPELARLSAEALAGYGYDCTVCASSEEALERFVSDPRAFDVLLTDQTMPALTGMNLIQRVRALRPDLPAVLASGYSDSVDALRARESSIVYVSKPAASDSLASAIAAALRGGSGENHPHASESS